MIDRSNMRDTPKKPSAVGGRDSVRNSRRGKPSWPAVMCDRTNQAGHMIASDPIKLLLNYLARRGPSTYGFWLNHIVRARAKCLRWIFGSRPDLFGADAIGAKVAVR